MPDRLLEGKRILITGGTGSLGHVLVRRLLSGEMGKPEKIIVFSRDEAKQHAMRIEYLHHRAPTDEVIYNNFEQLLNSELAMFAIFTALPPFCAMQMLSSMLQP
jgi:nucleoside-diphosphate-sugar epimerase